METKFTVGSDEWCALPDLGVAAVLARVDSGAKTSSLHATEIKTFDRDGQAWVSFVLHPLQNDGRLALRCESPVIDSRVVKSSSGERERRFVIRTQCHLGGRSWPIEVTLTNRDSMDYRMLLGREAMNGQLLVDPEHSCLLGERTEQELREAYKNRPVQTGGLRIAVLASNPDLYSNRRIIEAGAAHGHEMGFFNIKQCYMKLDSGRPEVHYRGGRVLDDLDAVIPRIRPSITQYGCALLRQFSSMKVYCQNSASAVACSRDKLHSLQLLTESGLPIPLSGFANSPQDTDDLIAMVGGAPLVVKLLQGTQGKGVVLSETKKASESVINAFKSLHADILVQEFVKEAGGKDLRLFVVRGKVVAAMQRSAPPGEFRANIHLGGSAKAIKVTPEERRIAIKSAKLMGLAVAGVDIIRSNSGPRVLEVNSSPGLEGVEMASGVDVASAMITAIEQEIGWKPPK
jgi:ribosomal protein S6--L-glutamate ligase